MYKLIPLLFICLVCLSCASTKERHHFAQGAEQQTTTMNKELLRAYLRAGDISGAHLRNIAAEKEIIPVNVDYEYFKSNRKKQNSAIIWVIYSRREKILLVDSYKRIYKLRGAIVSNSSEYYVDKINSLLYQRIKNNNFEVSKSNGVINIFKTIAILDGDYDDGRKKIDVLREWVGENTLEFIKQNFPERYSNIMKMSQ